MGTFLYRWSTAAQLVSVLMIALFYMTLARSLKRAEVRWWALAWWWNFAAIVVTCAYWFMAPAGIVARSISAGYVGGKIAFAVLLVQGAWALKRAGAQLLSPRTIGITIALAAVIGTLWLNTIDRIGVVVQGSMALLFLGCGVALLRKRAGLTSWLGAGFIARGCLAFLECFAYGAHGLPAAPVSTEMLSFFLGAHSSLDLAAEWLLALGGMLALARRGQRELEDANGELVAAQEELRRLADHDPLTGLANRRGLSESFRAVRECGATLVFCDLDGFKRINDTYGHAAGDACLVKFAAALRTCFRPEDTIVRYAGDEFLVVCGGMAPAGAEERVGLVREWLSDHQKSAITISFSAGVVPLKPFADPDQALTDADNAMYARKPGSARE